MNCREFTDFLMAYIDDELDADARRAFEAHIIDCPPCVHYLDSYRDAVALGKAVCEADEDVPADAPEGLVQAVLAARKQAT